MGGSLVIEMILYGKILTLAQQQYV